MVLDADEILQPSSVPLIREFAARDENAGYYFARLNREPGSEAPRTDYVVRLFPNRPAYRYRGRVHETIDASILAGGGRLVRTAISIDHDFASDPEARRRRNLWYIGILNEEIAADPGDSSRLDFLAAEYHQLGMFDRAAEIAERIVSMRPLDAQAHLFAGVYHLLYNTPDRARARADFREALRLRPGYAEAQSFLELWSSRTPALHRLDARYHDYEVAGLCRHRRLLKSEIDISAGRTNIRPIPSARAPAQAEVLRRRRMAGSKTSSYMPCYNPSTGAVIAYAPQCTADEVEEAIQAAVAAFPAWADTPVGKRVQVLFRLKALIEKNLEELTRLLATENGKKWDEAMGDVLKVVEVLEYACGAPHIMKGEALLNVSPGYDTTRYNHPVGVFAGIAPWNFPAMIPQGWMAPICLATGNCLVLKAASFVPQSAMRITELWQEAGLPAGVLNVVTTSRKEAEIFLSHPDIKGVSFVGSTGVGRHIYQSAAANGKRVQALTEAKNHALVLRDAKLDRTAQGIINAFCGCAGERCMALPVVVAENAIADKLVALLVKYASEIKAGAGNEKSTGMGPVVNQGHKDFVLKWIETGIKRRRRTDPGRAQSPSARGLREGVLRRSHDLRPCDRGNGGGAGGDLRPGAFDQAGRELRGRRAIMNDNRFANGSVIYTQSGYYARKFVKETHGGMVGVNVGIPVPVGIFGFTGQKQSFFGDLHMMGRDGFIFYTESRNVTATWFDEEREDAGKVDTWDGTMTLLER